MASKLYVGGLSYSTTSETLREYFAQCGTVESASVITDKFSGQSRGFGFVEMATAEEAPGGISELNVKDLDGRKITVNVSNPRTPGSGGGRGPGGPRGGGRGPGGPRGGGGDRGAYGVPPSKKPFRWEASRASEHEGARCRSPRPFALSAAGRRRLEDPLVAAVVVSRVHEPLHDVRARPWRNLARRGEDEAGVAGRGVDAAAHLGLDLRPGCLLEHGGVHVADRHRAPPGHLHEALELVHVQGRVALLVQVEGDGGEPAANQ